MRGVLEVFHRTPLALDGDWLDFLEALAGQATIAIETTYLFDGLQRSNVELSLAYDTTLEGWSRALDLRDKETEGHTQRVTELTMRLAGAMGLGRGRTGAHPARRAAARHRQDGRARQHPAQARPADRGGVGASCAGTRPAPTAARADRLSRARRWISRIATTRSWDGSGYPRGLKGEQIPLAARFSPWSTSGMPCAPTGPIALRGLVPASARAYPRRCPARTSIPAQFQLKDLGMAL